MEQLPGAFGKGRATATPDDYVLGEHWFRFTICARYGMDPAGEWFDALDPVVRIALMEFERAELVRKK